MVKRSIGIVLNEVRNQLWNCAHFRHKGALPKGAISFLRTVLAGAPNENIVQNHLNMALLNVL